MVPIGIELREYETLAGRSPFGEWFAKLDARAAAKVVVVLTRIGSGNLSEVKGVGGGVVERRINYGPGYRVYFGRDGATVVILLGGGTKQRQQGDIETARARWRDYLDRKRD
jgi:putative addiction module killer protein